MLIFLFLCCLFVGLLRFFLGFVFFLNVLQVPKLEQNKWQLLLPAVVVLHHEHKAITLPDTIHNKGSLC